MQLAAGRGVLKRLGDVNGDRGRHGRPLVLWASRVFAADASSVGSACRGEAPTEQGYADHEARDVPDRGFLIDHLQDGQQSDEPACDGEQGPTVRHAWVPTALTTAVTVLGLSEAAPVEPTAMALDGTEPEIADLDRILCRPSTETSGHHPLAGSSRSLPGVYRDGSAATACPVVAFQRTEKP